MERLALDLEIADVALDALEDDRRLDVHAEAARLANKYPYAAVTEEENRRGAQGRGGGR